MVVVMVVVIMVVVVVVITVVVMGGAHMTLLVRIPNWAKPTIMGTFIYFYLLTKHYYCF